MTARRRDPEVRRIYHDDAGTPGYHAELRHPPACAAVDHLLRLASTQPIILLTATSDVDHSGARVLGDHLTSRIR